MVKFIESELVLLKKEIDEMWTLVYNQLDRAGESVLTLDRELAQQVLIHERRVNAFELKIDSDVEDIIALYTPVAIDLRFVLAMLKINTNLERLGDFAEGIARFAIEEKELTFTNERSLKSLPTQGFPQYIGSVFATIASIIFSVVYPLTELFSKAMLNL